MRIRIIRKPLTPSIDGIRLDTFEPGLQYDVGNTVGALLLAEGWAAPVADEQPALLTPRPEPAKPAQSSPPNLIRETYPPYFDHLATAADGSKPRE